MFKKLIRAGRPPRIIHLKTISLTFGEDSRAYLPTNICGRSLSGLLDSGATTTVMGQGGWETLQQLGFKISNHHVFGVRLADNRFVRAKGTVDVPYTFATDLGDKVFVVPTLIVPSLPHSLIFGINFWRSVDLLPDIVRGKAYFREGLPELASVAVESNDSKPHQPEDVLTPQERGEIDALIAKYKPSLGKDVPGCTTQVAHTIDTGTAEPKKAKYFSYSPVLMKVLNDGLDELLAQDFVEPSNSPWSSSVIPLRKKDNSWRWVIDYRELNKVTKKDAYPLPKVNDILDQLKDAKYITSLDLKSAYHQIPLTPDSKEKTAFTIRGRGLFQWKRMPQGLHNAPATWQRFIDKVLGIDLQPYVFVYLDDIIIISSDFQQHLILLEKVLSRLESAGLTLKFEKCKWVMSELKYLGHIVDSRGLRVDADKVNDIVNFPRPRTVKQVRRFTSMSSWYRRFIKDFATIAAPLTALTKKNARFEWSDDCEQAFLTLKNHLISAPILACPDFSREFRLLCDASTTGIACVLSQEYEDGERIIACASRTLSKTERKYSPTELECLAVLFGIEKYRPYIEGSHFVVITDHASLKWLDNIKDPTGRIGRWALKMQQYDFTIFHRKGCDNVVPDAFSRIYEDEALSLITIDSLPSNDPWYDSLIQAVQAEPSKFPLFRCQEFQLYKLVSVGKNLPPAWVQVVPAHKREEVLKECHDSTMGGHFGIRKTLSRIKLLYYFPKMREFVTKYILKCSLCQAHKPVLLKPAGFMGTQRTATTPWEVVSADLMGPFPKSVDGNIHLLVVTDLFSKYVEIFPLKRAKAEDVVPLLELKIFLKYGVPRLLLFDNGGQFKCHLMNELCDKYNTTILFNYSHHPQANPTERYNQVLKRLMATFVSDYVKNHPELNPWQQGRKFPQRNWDKNLPELQASLNSIVNDVTGYSPHNLIFGNELVLDGRLRQLQVPADPVVPLIGPPDSHVKRLGLIKDLYADVVLRMKKAYEKSSKVYNLRRREVEFKVGQRVYRRNCSKSDKAQYYSRKLAPKFIGPFTIVKKVGRRGYLLQSSTGKKDGPWHINDLKLSPHVEDLSCLQYYWLSRVS